MRGGSLECVGLTKRFGRVTALDDLSLTVSPGSVHAIVGHNGAGKSTLAQIVAGLSAPDSGEVRYEGQIVSGGPAVARSLGIELVHQHFMLVPEFTTLENLALAVQDSVSGFLNLEEVLNRGQEVAEKLGWEIPWRSKVSGLEVGTRQRLEVVKALARGARMLILDEPTATLSNQETVDLLNAIRQLAAEGMTLILIAHKLKEVFSVSDEITVLRSGRKVLGGRTADLTPEAVAEAMLGSQSEPEERVAERSIGEPTLQFSGVSTSSRGAIVDLKGIDLEVCAGEIVGIGGVDGNGQTALAESSVDLRSPSSGKIVRSGRFSYVPGDRHREGLALGMSLSDNLLAGHEHRADLCRNGVLRSRPIREWAANLLTRFGLVYRDVSQTARELSGGNQQKLVLARALEDSPDLLVCVNPSRGLDIGAVADVERQLVAAAEAGCGILLITTDNEELERICHRVLYLGSGRLFESAQEAVSAH